MESSASVPTFTTGPLREYVLPVSAVLLSIVLPFYLIAWMYIIVGHAHFLMAYLYQYRGKRMNFSYLLVAAAVLIASLWYFFVADLGFMPILVVAGILFALHFAIDEFTLHGEPFGREAWIAIAGFTLLFSSLVVLVALPALTWLSSAAYGVLAGTVIVRLLLSRKPILKTERYLFLIGVLLLLLGAALNLPTHVLGVILLLHFMNWYVGYGVRLRARPERLRIYWKEVAVTLGICTALFAAFVYSEGTFLYALFGFTPYYAWAIAHILLSFVSSGSRSSAV
jgi:hypothetical protein